LKNDSSLKSIPVVYFSANSDIQSLTKQAGADAFLAKPFDLDELQNVVAAYL
jgi:two-component system cell cycle response regulator DivK